MSIVFLKSGSKGFDGKEQNDKSGMVRIMCNMSDAQVHVKPVGLLSMLNILYSTHPIGVCSKIFYKTALWWIFFFHNLSKNINSTCFYKQSKSILK